MNRKLLMLALLCSTFFLSGCNEWSFKIEEEVTSRYVMGLAAAEREHQRQLVYDEKMELLRDVRLKLYAELFWKSVNYFIWIGVPIIGALCGIYIVCKKQAAVVAITNDALVQIERIKAFTIVFNGSSAADRSSLVNGTHRLPFDG